MQENKNLRLSILFCNIITHYDTTIYALLIPTIAPLFFDNQTPMLAIIKGYAGLLLGIISRPLGILYFAKLENINGYVHAFAKSALGITLTTCAIVILPTQDKFSIIAPIALLSIRSLQSFFSAGENNLAKIYIMSNKDCANYEHYAAQYEISCLTGITLAFISAYFCSKQPNFWRFAFLFPCLGIILSTIIRFQFSKALQDSKPSQVAINSTKKLLTIIKSNKKVLLQISVLHGFNYFTYSLVFIFTNVFIPTVDPHITYKQMLSLNIPFLGLDIFVLLALYYSKILNTRFRIVVFLPPLLAILIFVTFCQTGTRLYLCANVLRGITVIIGVICSIAFAGVIFSASKKVSKDSYILYGILYCIGSDLLGRSLPAIGLFLTHYLQSLWPAVLFCICICTYTSLCYSALQKFIQKD